MRAVVLAVMLALSAGGARAEIADLGAAAQGWINATRAEAGRGALRVSAPLTRAAAAHAADLARSGRFSHDGSSVGDRVRRQGYGYCFAAENLAKGQGRLDEVLRGWMRSPGHRRNMLSEHAVEFGLVRGAGRIWVMVLGRSGC